MPDVSIVPYATPFEPTAAVAAAKDSAMALSAHSSCSRVSPRSTSRSSFSIGLWKWTEAAGVAPHAKFNLRYVSDGVRQPSRSGEHQPRARVDAQVDHRAAASEEPGRQTTCVPSSPPTGWRAW